MADTALKTADAGYLTRRLVDVAHDVIITEKDCGTLRGLSIGALKRGKEIVESLYDRILGRVALHDIFHPQTGELLCNGGDEITEEIAKKICDSPLKDQTIEIRSVLTCESKHGVCANCYGRNLASGKLVQRGEAVGVIAAQSIGEPGTQLTLRTFHQGGTASSTSDDSMIKAEYAGKLVINDLNAVDYKDKEGREYQVVVSRASEMKIIDHNTGVALITENIPYGSKLYIPAGNDVNVGDVICEWDKYNSLIITEHEGKVRFDNIVEGVTFRNESDERTGYSERVIIEGRRFSKNPSISILDKQGEVIRTYDLPVGAHIMVEDGDKIMAGDVLTKKPRATGGLGDITGGLPRVTELFEARNSSEPAVVSEIDGEVSFEKKLVRGNRVVVVTSKTGESKRYLIPTTKEILASENDYVKAGQPLSEGAITPANILAIEGPMKVQEFIVNNIQEVYRSQGVTINGKHFEVIVRQMMRKVEIDDPGDSETLLAGQIITARRLRDENSALKRRDKKIVESRDAKPATAHQVLQGITRAALQTESFISAASFQETTKVLTQAAISAKTDYLEGMKENVIVGHKIPAGTGLRDFDDIIVGAKEDFEPVVDTETVEA